MEKKSEKSEQNFTESKVLIYALLCNVQKWVSWFRNSKNEEK